VNRAKLYYLRGKVGKRARVRAKRGVPLPVMETAPSESDMPPEDVEPEGLEEVVAEDEAAAEEEPPAEEPTAEEPAAQAEPEPEPQPVAKESS
jgi:large subunit ribosomal protein L19